MNDECWMRVYVSDSPLLLLLQSSAHVAVKPKNFFCCLEILLFEYSNNTKWIILLFFFFFNFYTRCQIAVHQECYGARNVRDFTSWVCRACETPDVERECCLCPVKGMFPRLRGISSYRNVKPWLACHLYLCSFIMNNVFFLNNARERMLCLVVSCQEVLAFSLFYPPYVKSPLFLGWS